jgi:hypothetical protein
MSTLVLDFVADAQSSVKMKWEEQYATEGMNRKQAFVTPRGIYRGFRIVPSATPMHVTIQADPVAQDHIMIYETGPAATGPGYSIAIHKAPGNFDVDLTAFANQTVVLAVYSTYAIGFTTTAQLLAYQLSPTDQFNTAPERGEVVVLGTVVVPTSGVILPANIGPNFRTSAWEATPPELHPFSALNVNPSFDAGPLGLLNTQCFQAIPGWGISASASIQFATVNTDTATTTSRRSLEVEAVASGPTTVSSLSIGQVGSLPVYPGQRIKMSFSYKVLVPNTGPGALALACIFVQEESNAPVITTVSGPSVQMAATTPGWVTSQFEFEVPANAGILYGFFLGASGGNLTFASPGVGAPLFRIDDLQIWVESEVHLPPGLLQYNWATRNAGALIMRDPAFNEVPPDANHVEGLLIWRDQLMGNQAGLQVGRNDQNQSSNNQPLLNILGQIIAGLGLAAGGTPDIPRLIAQTDNTSRYQPLLSSVWQSLNTPVAPLVNFYQGLNGTDVELTITLNAVWSTSGTNWNKTYNADPAYRLVFTQRSTIDSAPHVRVDVRSAAGPWTDTVGAGGWDASIFDFRLDNPPTLASIAKLIGGLQLGTGLVDASAPTQTARITAVGNQDASTNNPGRVLVNDWYYGAASTQAHVRVYFVHYAHATPHNSMFEITINARWDDSAHQWNSDDATLPAYLYEFGAQADGFFMSAQQPSASWSGFNLGAYYNLNFFNLASGNVATITAQIGNAGGANPGNEYTNLTVAGNLNNDFNPGGFISLQNFSVTGGMANFFETLGDSVYSYNIVKAWGAFTTSGVGSVDPTGNHSSFGIIGASQPGTEVQIEYSFSVANFTGDDQCILLMSDDGVMLGVSSYTFDTVNIRGFQWNGGSGIVHLDLSVDIIDIWVAVLANTQ